MTKRFSEMSLEELWELFPIYLTEHQNSWSEWYEEEVSFLRSILSNIFDLRIHHIGSTAIHGIWVKPIIDILIETPDIVTLKTIKDQMTADGYICMSDNRDRVSLNKGYTENGFAEKIYHIHLRLMNDNDEVYFRDYLNAHPEIAKEYEKLKMSLWKKHEYNRDAYTKEKTEFVAHYTELAKKLYTYDTL